MIKEFAAKVASEIQSYLPAEFKECSIEIQSVEKNNETLTGLCFKRPGINIAPVVYLDHYLGLPVDETCISIADGLAKLEVPKFDVNDVYDYEKVKDMIIPRLVSVQNEKYLEDKVYLTLEEPNDIAVTYYIALSLNDDGNTQTIAIPLKALEDWGITKEELHAQAMKNVRAVLKPVCRTLGDVLKEDMIKHGASEEQIEAQIGHLPDTGLRYISSSTGMFGAPAILDHEFMDQTLENLGLTVVYVIPSSIHEVLIISKDKVHCIESLCSLVKTVNMTQVEPQDRLTDSIYLYDPDFGLSRVIVDKKPKNLIALISPFYTKQFLLYDKENDAYIIPPDEVRDEIEKIRWEGGKETAESVDAAQERLLEIVKEDPDWLYDEDRINYDDGTGLLYLSTATKYSQHLKERTETLSAE